MSGVTISLDQLLMLVGELNDQSGNDTPRDRFRQFLQDSVKSLGTVRDYVDVCLNKSGTQYHRALQDLVNHTGRLMGFDVEFGRYAGVTNDIGHDGLWKTEDFSIVVEVKTTDVFSVKTAPLLGYIHSLIDAGKISNSDNAIGLYVFGKPDAQLEQLEGAIVHGGHSQRLRISTVDDVLSLAELVQDGALSRDEAVTLLRPVGVRVGSTVQLLKRIASVAPIVEDSSLPQPIAAKPTKYEMPSPVSKSVAESSPPSDRLYLLTPVASEDGISAEETIRKLLDNGVYVFGDKTPGRKQLKPGDMIAFYQSGTGVVASAMVSSKPELKKVSNVKHAEKFPWSFKVKNVKYFFESPVAIDAVLRAKLKAFDGRDPQKSWSWFVQGTRPVNEHDFVILTDA